MKILIIGAGAVGMVYGQHFAQAGHQVCFMVKEKYQADLENNKQLGGEKLYFLNKDKKLKNPLLFNRFSSINDWSLEQSFDLVVLAISSNALRSLPLELLEQQLKSNQQNYASLLMLQPSDSDLDYLASQIDPELILQGMINMISYQTPLNDAPASGDSHVSDNAIAYYLPFTAMPISSAGTTTEAIERRTEVIKLFNQSAIKATAVHSALDQSRLPSAFLASFLCVLEANDWQFDRLRNNPQHLHLLSRSQRFLLPNLLPTSQAKFKKIVTSKLLNVTLRPWLYKLLLRIADPVLPLPLEAYLKKHFLKVHEQTKLYMQEYNQQLPDKSLQQLLALMK